MRAVQKYDRRAVAAYDGVFTPLTPYRVRRGKGSNDIFLPLGQNEIVEELLVPGDRFDVLDVDADLCPMRLMNVR